MMTLDDEKSPERSRDRSAAHGKVGEVGDCLIWASVSLQHGAPPDARAARAYGHGIRISCTQAPPLYAHIDLRPVGRHLVAQPARASHQLDLDPVRRANRRDLGDEIAHHLR